MANGGRARADDGVRVSREVGWRRDPWNQELELKHPGFSSSVRENRTPEGSGDMDRVRIQVGEEQVMAQESQDVRLWFSVFVS